jgi:hypothetical protein
MARIIFSALNFQFIILSRVGVCVTYRRIFEWMIGFNLYLIHSTRNSTEVGSLLFIISG